MKNLILILLLFLISVPALAANVPPAGNNGDIQYNNNQRIGAYAIGPGLVATTSGNTTFLSSTSTGGVSPAGPMGAIQYNCSGSFCGYTLGNNLSVTGGVLSFLPQGPAGDVELSAGANLGSISLSGNAILGAAVGGTPTNILIGSGLTLTTTGGVTTISATGGGGGGCPSTAIIQENGPCIIEENGPFIIEE